MTARYIALITHEAALQTRFRCVMERQGDLVEVHKSVRMTVYADRQATFTRLSDGRGIVLGPLFKRNSSERVAALDQAASTSIAASGAARLITDYWGGYVALLEADHSQVPTALRDPSGALPCFYSSNQAMLLIASDIETLIDSGFVHPSIDWSYLPGHLGFYDLRTERTALSGVRELRPGVRLVAGIRRTTTPLWSPWDFTRPTTDLADDAAANLRETVTTCVNAWASQFRKILLGMSGGLDSSILAACLAQQATPWSAFTMITDDSTGDERRYARVMASHVNVGLQVGRNDLIDVQLGTSRSAHLPRPTGFGFGQSQDKVVSTLAAAEQADAHFTGIGGDNVFCLMTSATSIADRALSGDGAIAVIASALDICRLTGCSLWEALAGAGRRYFSRKPAFGRCPQLRFLVKGPRKSHLAFEHPWLDLPKHALPGKAVHVAMLARIHGTADGYPRSTTTPLIMPLLSQPIIEACLAIPTWKWCAGGANRAVVRRAFADQLPDAILHRTSKGGPEGFCANVLEYQKALLRPFLLDGELASHGILDLEELRSTINTDAPLSENDLPVLAKIVEAEAWCRHWSQKSLATLPHTSPVSAVALP